MQNEGTTQKRVDLSGKDVSRESKGWIRICKDHLAFKDFPYAMTTYRLVFLYVENFRSRQFEKSLTTNSNCTGSNCTVHSYLKD